MAHTRSDFKNKRKAGYSNAMNTNKRLAIRLMDGHPDRPEVLAGMEEESFKVYQLLPNSIVDPKKAEQFFDARECTFDNIEVDIPQSSGPSVQKKLRDLIFNREMDDMTRELVPWNVVGNMNYYLQLAGLPLNGTTKGKAKNVFTGKGIFVREDMLLMLSAMSGHFRPLEEGLTNREGNVVVPATMMQKQDDDVPKVRFIVKGLSGIGKSVSTILLLDVLPCVLPDLKKKNHGIIITFWSGNQKNQEPVRQYLFESPGGEGCKMFEISPPQKDLILPNFIRIEDGLSVDSIEKCHCIITTSQSAWGDDSGNSSDNVRDKVWYMCPWEEDEVVVGKYMLFDVLDIYTHNIPWSECRRRYSIIGGQFSNIITEQEKKMVPVSTSGVGAVQQLETRVIEWMAEFKADQLLHFSNPELALTVLTVFIKKDTLAPYSPPITCGGQVYKPDRVTFLLDPVPELMQNKQRRWLSPHVKSLVGKYGQRVSVQKQMQILDQPTKGTGETMQEAILEKMLSKEPYKFFTLKRLNTNPNESHKEEVRKILDFRKHAMEHTAIDRPIDETHTRKCSLVYMDGDFEVMPTEVGRFRLLTTTNKTTPSVDAILIHWVHEETDEQGHLKPAALDIYMLQMTHSKQHVMRACNLSDILGELKRKAPAEHQSKFDNAQVHIVYVVCYLMSHFRDDADKGHGFHFMKFEAKKENKKTDIGNPYNLINSAKIKRKMLNKAKCWSLTLSLTPDINWETNPGAYSSMIKSHEVPVQTESGEFGKPGEYQQLYGQLWYDRAHAEFFCDMNDKLPADQKMKNASYPGEFDLWATKQILAYKDNILTNLTEAERKTGEERERGESQE